MTNQDIKNITSESLRDWFKKEKWVRISTSGNIAGPCGTSKNKKNPDRCLPAAKARSLTKAQRAATAAKKKKAGAKGKTVVKNTKAAKVTRENNDRSFTKDDMKDFIYETIGGYLERYLGYNPGPPNHPMYKMTPEQMSAYIAQQFMDGIDELLDETDATIELIREGIEEAYEDYKKISMGVGHDPDMHFEPEEEKIGADALEMVLQTLDKMATPTKLETANPQDGKAAPYGSGYKPIKKMKKETKEAPDGHYFTKSGNLVKGRMSADAKERGARKSDPKDKQRSKVPPVTQYSEMTKEDLRNLIVGTIAEFKNEDTIMEKDDRCTRIAKRKYDTWPSAYASGAVVRCRRGEIWKGVSEEADHSETEIKIGDYQTKHYHMCPGAKSLYQDIEDKVDDMDLAVRTAKLQDALFALEMTALEDGATEADLDAAQLIADQIMAMAKMMGLEKEHNYIQGHVDKIKGAVK